LMYVYAPWKILTTQTRSLKASYVAASHDDP